jgi:hypothetical protein
MRRCELFSAAHAATASATGDGGAIQLFKGAIRRVEEDGGVVPAEVIVETARPVAVDDAHALQPGGEAMENAKRFGR